MTVNISFLHLKTYDTLLCYIITLTFSSKVNSTLLLQNSNNMLQSTNWTLSWVSSQKYFFFRTLQTYFICLKAFFWTFYRKLFITQTFLSRAWKVIVFWKGEIETFKTLCIYIFKLFYYDFWSDKLVEIWFFFILFPVYHY